MNNRLKNKKNKNDIKSSCKRNNNFLHNQENTQRIKNKEKKQNQSCKNDAIQHKRKTKFSYSKHSAKNIISQDTKNKNLSLSFSSQSSSIKFHNSRSDMTNYNKIIEKKNSIDPKILKKQRDEEILVYGEHACQAIFYSRPECIVRAWFTKNEINRFKKELHWMVKNRKAYHIVNNVDLIKTSSTKHHGGICLLIKKRKGIIVKKWLRKARYNSNSSCIIALSDIGNPYNLGAIIRSCSYFNVQGILLRDVSLLESGATIRTAEGGAEYIQPIIGTNILEDIKKFYKSGYSIVLPTFSRKKGISIFNANMPSKIVLVLGETIDNFSSSIFYKDILNIFIDGTDNVSSLNISVSTGIFLAEWWRQNK